MATFVKTLFAVVLALAMVSAAGCGSDEGRSTRGGKPAAPTTQTSAIRIGLVPERDIYSLRGSYLKLAAYLSGKLDQPVEVVTLNTYQNILLDFEEKSVDAAFLGSLVAVLAMDRYGAGVALKPEQPDGTSTYRGLIVVREDSPIRSFDDLRGRSLAVLRATYAGALFPVWLMSNHNMLERPGTPTLVAVGTHDEGIEAVLNGRADAAAVKDLRLYAYQREHPQSRFRVIEQCAPVPNNALVLRKDVDKALETRLVAALKSMEKDPQARPALEALGAARFVECRPEEYAPIFRMTREIGPSWELVGTGGPVPTTRPSGGR